MTLELSPNDPKDDQPWRRIIVCGPGDMEKIKKAGEDTRKLAENSPKIPTLSGKSDKKTAP